jgi:TatD DNase family protein
MFIDAHAHVDQYAEDLLHQALEQIQQHHILTVSNSMDISSYEKNKEIAKKCPWVLACFGAHPWNAPDLAGRLEEFQGYADESPMLGEIGLDFHFVTDSSQYSAQQTVCEHLLQLARAQDKIVNLHTKGAEQQVADLLDAHRITKAIVHWYSGPESALGRMIDRGFYFTVGVELLQSKRIQTMARRVPLKLLLTETDNPGGLKWLTGKPGMPGILGDVVAQLARLRGTDQEEMAQIVEDNFERLIGDDPRLSQWYRDLQPNR